MSDVLFNCLLCDDLLSDKLKYSLFQSLTPHSGTLLLNLFQQITHLCVNGLNPDLTFLCESCYTLLERFDFAEILKLEVKSKIDSYLEIKYKNILPQNYVEVACQTEYFLYENSNLSNDSYISNAVGTEKKILNNQCDFCARSFKTPTDLKKHLKAHQSKNNFECKICHTLYTTKAGLVGHINKKHKLKNVEKNIEPSDIVECNIKVEDGEAEKDSGEIDHREDSVFNNEETPSDNDQIFNNESIADQEKLNSDSADAIVSKPKRSKLGNKSEQSNRNDNNSLRSSRSKRRGRPKKTVVSDDIVVKPYIFECPQCPKKWRTKSELRIHLVSHSDVRAHICDICGQAYKKRRALDIHLGMHNGINPYTCTTCGKVFTQKGALNRHLPIHTGEANYQCDLCGKRYIHHTSFSMHVLTHSGLKAYKCEICGLGLMSTSHLKRHMRAHSGEKKYGCSTCGKRFAERYNLAAHERLHFFPGGMRKRNHQCPLCGETFQRRQRLEEHLSNNHNKILDNDESRKWTETVLNSYTPWPPGFPTGPDNNSSDVATT